MSAQNLLSDELMQSLGSSGSGDLVILGGKKNNPNSDSQSKKVSVKRILSNSQRRKQMLIEEKKRKKANRKELLDSLQKSSLSEDQRKYLQKSKTLGKQPSVKERLRREIELQKINLLPEESELYRKRKNFVDEKELDLIESEESASSDSRENSDYEASSQPIKVVVNPVEQEIVFTRPNYDVAKNSERTKKPKKRRVVLSQASDLENIETKKTSSIPEMENKADLNSCLESSKDSKSEPSNQPILPKNVPRSAQKLSKFHVIVERDESIQQQREALPIYGEEQVLIETIGTNFFVIVCGATGSGKTTQLPQFLLENGYSFPEAGLPGLIGVTQPRRVAAISTCQRVSTELGNYGSCVGYQIRYDNKVDEDKTRIKFMTDGILLKEIEGDFLLKKYSVILVDEAHERNLNTDVLIGLLSRIIPLRIKKKLSPLRVVIMSATLRVKDFTENSSLFPLGPPPVIEIAARQFPVTTHFNRKTEMSDYVDAAFRKICKIHTKLPPGGILVFLTGKQEIEYLCRKLRNRFQTHQIHAKTGIVLASDDQDDPDFKDLSNFEADDSEEETILNEDSVYSASQSIPYQETSQIQKVKVLPLYSLLSTEKQMKVFEDIEDESQERLIVVSTNVAETSITIPGVKYVVDSGREKSKVYDRVTGISTFVVDWISKASADQRAGRAGRVSAGHCYRLYSSAVFNNRFAEFSAPEIATVPIDGMILQMKNMGIHDVIRFPFPTPPDQDALTSAICMLKNLGLLDSDEKMTSLGRIVSSFPVSPRYGKMLALSKQGNCLPYIVAIVASMSVGNLYLHDVSDVITNQHTDSPNSEDNLEETIISSPDMGNGSTSSAEKSRRQRLLNAARQYFSSNMSDAISDLKVVCASDYASNLKEFCEDYFLHEKAMNEIAKLRLQLMRVILKSFDVDHCGLPSSFDEQLELNENEGSLIDSVPIIQVDRESLKLEPPTLTQESLICQIIAAGFIDQIARKYPELPILPGQTAPTDINKSAYQCLVTESPVFIHPHSQFFHRAKQPELLVYQELIASKKSYMKGITVLNPEHLSVIAMGSPLCSLGPPLESPAAVYDSEEDAIYCFVRANFGNYGWKLPVQKILFPEDSEKLRRQKCFVFIRLLLEGRVLPCLGSFKNFWIARPSSFVSLPSHLQNRSVLKFLDLMLEYKVLSLASLKKAWEGHQEQILDHFLELMRKPAQSDLKNKLLLLFGPENKGFSS